jgi:hypothetical protein
MTTQPARQRYFSTFELILLALFSSHVVVSKIVLHLPLRLPGHSGAFWMAILEGSAMKRTVDPIGNVAIIPADKCVIKALDLMRQVLADHLAERAELAEVR